MNDFTCTPGPRPGRLAAPSAALVLAATLLAACGGGGGSNGGGNGNSPPVANAGPDQTVVELATVTLSGSATDPNAGNTFTYAWTQQSGQGVTLVDASSAQASFVAPDVQAGAPEDLGFRLTVTDNAGASDTDDVLITVQEPGDVVTISGNVQYEFVPPNGNCNGLNYGDITPRAVRQATVQILASGSNTVLGADATDDDGNYSITVDPGVDVFVRVRAELKRGGTPGWDVEVRNNTANTGNPLNQRPMYVLDSGSFGSGAVDQVRNLTATTGWNGTNYASTRAAAPFAVLDTIYSAMQLVLEADAATVFPPLDAYWSTANNSSDGSGDFNADIAAGDLGTSFYQSGINALFLLGAANDDTEEFDDHVIAHEWGHYFEDVFSRSDSIGGSHSLGDRLDMRVAFGEGWATALSGMALANPTYCDTLGPGQAQGFGIDIEGGSSNPRGWYNEESVLALIYDLWDSDIDGVDTDSIGFGPIFEAMTQVQRTTAAYTSIFSFTEAVQSVSPASATFVDALRASHDINGTGIYGDGETNDASATPVEDVLPVYTNISPNGTPLNICSNRQFDDTFDGNKLSEYRYLRMTITAPGRYRFEVTTDAATVAQLPADDPGSETDQSDPDMYVYRNGNLQAVGDSGEANHEVFDSPNSLPAGDYVLDVLEFRHADSDTDPAFPEQSCFDITVQAI